jgi:hypothetical protein
MLKGLKTMSKIAPAKIVSQKSHVVPGTLPDAMAMMYFADSTARQTEGD